MKKKVIILIENGFRDEEALYPYYRLLEAGHVVDIAGRVKTVFHGKFGMPLKANKTLKELRSTMYDAVIIPGGLNCPDKLRMDQNVLRFVKNMFLQKKVVAAICHGSWVPASAGIVKRKKVTGYKAIKDDLQNAGGLFINKSVVVDRNIITSRHPGDLPDFLREILKQLK